MNLSIFSIILAVSPLVCAELVPEISSISRYRELVDNSPFTDPAVPVLPPIVKELPNWSLIGVSKYRDEQFVTVVNLKDRSQRIEIPGADANELGFRLLEVEVARNFLNTRVKVEKGRETGWLEYNPKLLTIKKAPKKVAPAKEVSKETLPPVPGKRVRYVPRPK